MCLTPFHYQISFADETVTVTEMWSVTLDKLARKFAHDHKISAIFKHFRNLSPSQDSMVCLPSPKPVGLVIMGPDTEHSYDGIHIFSVVSGTRYLPCLLDHVLWQLQHQSYE